MMVTRKYLSRRTILKGLGAAISLPLLEVGELVEGTVSTETNAAFYAVRSDSPWAVSYVKADGDMDVELTVNRVTRRVGVLEEVALVEGEELSEVALGIFEEDETYIIRLGEPLFSFTFNEEEADYTLEILTFED